MARSLPGKKSVVLQVPEKEYERIKAAADARGLGDPSFILMVVAGAISQGGGTLDRLVDVGSRVIPVRRRREENFEGKWTYTVHGTWVWGRWELFKLNPRNSKNSNDPTNWWRLKHANFPTVSRPIAFSRKEAIREASKLIASGYHPVTSMSRSRDNQGPLNKHTKSDRPT